ncbi:hypothetical protein A3K01_01180 [candidate division WWE3 bacterium RIFOXYD1_FULL_43_17]|uniref:Uncharacterized protein n=3 Tax=Katanobacteria TaxID=422282 RepID=A0A1F4XB30_UNCKA|nr:MAG: hypothetical protein UU59_C0004G0023 [candidate division WWE3 bacterium GW2011_GWE1_41_27]KKS60579.1 MAG: hypothetical protein UV26_C0003G0033 [candidate division WWE3 bacterium GW2011_GWF2_42_42]OGC78915.1 MAG: hypothetical protein A3K01_01180 [candidate division WWE3 bacterium RIFOXYD1_FULL_43_17]
MFETMRFKSLLNAQGIETVTVKHVVKEPPGVTHACGQPSRDYLVKSRSINQVSSELMLDIINWLEFRDSRSNITRLSGTLYVQTTLD